MSIFSGKGFLGLVFFSLVLTTQPVLAQAAVAPSAPAATAPAATAPAATSQRESRLLRLRTAPPAARALLDGAPVALRPGPNGERQARIGTGGALLLVEADGFYPEVQRIGAGRSDLLVELKLERPSEALRLRGFGGTGARPKSVAYGPGGTYLILPLLSGPGADVLDAFTLKRITRLEPPAEYARWEGFVESASFPRLGEIWVSQMHTSKIHVFDSAGLRYKESFPSGGNFPKVIAASPDGLRAYVSNWISGDVSVIDAASRSLLWKARIGGTPRGLAPSPDGRHLYVARFGDGGISRVDLVSRNVEEFWRPDGGAKRHLVLDAKAGRLYASDMHRGSLFVLALPEGSLVAEIALGENPNTIALSPDGRRLWATTRGPNHAADYELPGPAFGELVEVDLASLRVTGRQFGGNQPTGLAVSPDGGSLVFTDFLDRRVEAYDIPGGARGSPRPPR